MSYQSVQRFLAERAPELNIMPLERNSETNWLSGLLGIKPAQIAKALTLRVNDRNLLLMACGDARLDNRKVKAAFGGKARMLPAAEVEALTGHPVGGVCPFGLAVPLDIHCDILLQRYEIVVTGGGDPRWAIRVNPLRMAEITQAVWVDVCESPP